MIKQTCSSAFSAGELSEQWKSERNCPFGITLTTPAGPIVFNATSESYHSWHNGRIFIEGSPEASFASVDNCSSPAPSGIYEGDVPFGQEICQMLLELDHAPSALTLPPYIRVHSLSCTSPADDLRAAAIPAPRPVLTDTAKPPRGAMAAPKSRLRVEDVISTTAPIVEVINMSAPSTVFVATKDSHSVLAAFASRTIPASTGGELVSYWLIAAPQAVALGSCFSLLRQGTFI